MVFYQLILKLRKSAKVISELSYEEAMELAHAGAEVLFLHL